MVHDQIITIQLVWFKNKAKFQSWEGSTKNLDRERMMIWWRYQKRLSFFCYVLKLAQDLQLMLHSCIINDVDNTPCSCKSFIKSVFLPLRKKIVCCVWQLVLRTLGWLTSIIVITNTAWKTAHTQLMVIRASLFRICP